MLNAIILIPPRQCDSLKRGVDNYEMVASTKKPRAGTGTGVLAHSRASRQAIIPCKSTYLQKLGLDLR